MKVGETWRYKLKKFSHEKVEITYIYKDAEEIIRMDEDLDVWNEIFCEEIVRPGELSIQCMHEDGKEGVYPRKVFVHDFEKCWE